MLEGILTFLRCLPKLIAIIDRMGRLMDEHNISQWMTDLETALDKLEKAQSSDEKAQAAKLLVNSIRSLN